MDDPNLAGEELTSELQKRLDQITVANDVMTADILQATGSVLDTDGLQMEALIQGLRDVGVITDRQAVTIKLAWAKQHNNMLRGTIGQIKKQMDEQAKNQSKLATPQRKLIVPGR